MSGIARKRQRVYFCIYEEKGRRVTSYLFDEFPLRRQAVWDRCLADFEDDNPCYIHEGAAKLRMLNELEAYLARQPGPVPIEHLPENLSNYLPENLENARIGYTVETN